MPFWTSCSETCGNLDYDNLDYDNLDYDNLDYDEAAVFFA